MNTAQRDSQRNGVTRSQTKTLDPLTKLCTPDTPKARVSISVGTQYDFGRIKVNATVSYECDQTSAAVDEAGLLAFTKAVEFMEDGLSLLAGEEEKAP